MELDISYYEKLRDEFRPKIIELLLISEAPPPGCPIRFFYDSNTNKYDSLYLEIMSVIFLGLTQGVRGERTRSCTTKLRQYKACYLKRFQENGFWLQDTVPYPLNGRDPSEAIKDNVGRIEKLISKYDIKKCILISDSVFQIKDTLTKNTCVKVLNELSLPFAGQGHQAEFRKEFSKILFRNGFINKGNEKLKDNHGNQACS